MSRRRLLYDAINYSTVPTICRTKFTFLLLVRREIRYAGRTKFTSLLLVRRTKHNIRRTKTGDFSVYLNDLETAGFAARDFTWNLKSEKQSKLSHYRLKDNYVRFYLKYIEPNKAKITQGLFNENSITTLPAWESILGLQFQNLVLNNAIAIIKKLGITVEDVLFVNSFFQQKTKSQPGCQIDLLIQTKYNCLFICEIKFSKTTISTSIIEEVQKKINHIKMPKNFSYRPVLIHVNGVAPAVLEKQYFSKIIDFGEILSAG